MGKSFVKRSLSAAFSLMLVMLVLCSALAEAFDSEKPLADYSDDELRSALSGYDAASIAIYSELGRRIREEKTTVEEKHLGTIEQLFPDEVVACYIRDELNKLSIKQPVTQEELDTITRFGVSDDYGDEIYDITGIGYLRNLTYVSFYTNNGWCSHYMGETISDELYTLTKLEYLNLSWINPTKLKSLSDKLGNLTELTYLGLENTQITELPESIGKLQKLKTLNITKTKINELPDSIWTLPLEKIDMAGTGVR